MPYSSERPNVRPMQRFTVHEAAALLGVKDSTMYRYLHCGFYKKGTDWGEREINGRTWISGKMILKIWDSEGRHKYLEIYERSSK